MYITLFGDKLSIAQSNKIRMWADAQLDGRPGGALCERSLIPFLVPRRKVWLTSVARVPCSHAANIGERKTWTRSEFCIWRNSVRGQELQKMCIQCIPAQETAKHHAKFGWPPVNDVAAVTKPRRETRWNVLGCTKLASGSQPLVGRSSPYCEYIWRIYCCLTIFADCRYMP